MILIIQILITEKLTYEPIVRLSSLPFTVTHRTPHATQQVETMIDHHLLDRID